MNAINTLIVGVKATIDLKKECPETKKKFISD
jgi:hypothetical protein